MEVPQGGPQTSLICDGLSAYGPFMLNSIRDELFYSVTPLTSLTLR